jgi:DNA invertase Pin-like site-specific DNA recombinase
MSDTKNNKTIAIYARVSTDRQSEEMQLAELRDFAKRSNWQIFNEYIDHESGGKNNREDFQKLFEDASRRKFDYVLVWSLDRFTREGVLPTLSYLHRLNDYGIGFKSYTEQYLDTTGIFKDAVIGILATVAKQERLRISQRVKAGLENARRKGKRLGRPPIPSSVLQRAKELKAQGMSYRKIGLKLGVDESTLRKNGI